MPKDTLFTTPKILNTMTKIKALTVQAWVAIALAIVAAATFITGMIIPPPGEVHPSVIQGIGLMIILVAIFFAWDAVIRGMETKFEHGKTKVTIGKRNTAHSEKERNNDETDQ